MPHTDPDILLEKARRIRLLVLDVDGVLTDGRITYTAEGVQVQSFHVRDGFGIKRLQEAGVAVAILSARRSEALARRAAELGIDRVIQGKESKTAAFDGLLAETGLTDDEVAYVGDDWVDLPILRRVGLAVAVADAAPPLADYAHFVTARPGGRGAVREVCDLILRAQNRWADCLNRYLNPGVP
ncbi:HAD-IIIA family hydrolase [Dissulfurirhabdus thermomarina]|uniref:HAD-IIIA family hydrolase n=1 Tax=Dissulfurirhabdus thermomarina TaxID=1765737 RepID=A0A6N9TKE8_DISTH|nr:HAD-IIIA family hydrolase [Dissulfurirhabdus thermomarina]NDY41725.1 HAD-IIIA family hydrolase [Dissulfurirhabdus thermomarina]NMX23661.1 HAD-IIIA family hydrolase [Dissulfurirhabdus thermomarina]